ncbi:TonB-dependent receptor plug domain-containing protein [Sediminicola luteus]|uniref:TonB-dependent receptor n=1 Tax=Sediminicola luteus TaxID=319238 RepID=A0A2A4G0B4_9FLAO|nr:TonB-dependent receptor plug domain-containing protein [Sediminicola luteus]PCE62439.1 TonB-dependent receptor [Sediminicola luteus]
MIKKRMYGLWAMACVGFIAHAQQQESETQLQELDEVVVTDTKLALNRAQSGKTVITITKAEIVAAQGLKVSELIARKSGIEIAGSRGREGSVYGVFVRGGRGRQVLVLIDGIRVNDPSSGGQEYDLRMLDLSQIESMEIIKGAASTLYGTNAATAVIKIKTKTAGKEKISATIGSNLGTNNTAENRNSNIANFSNNINLNGTLGAFNYVVGFGQRYADGMSAIETNTNEEDPFSSFNTDLKLGYAISDKWNLSVFGNHSKMRTEFDESFGNIDAPYVYTSEQKRVGLNSNYSYGKGSLHVKGAYSEYDSESVSAFPATYEGENWVMDIYNTHAFNEQWQTVIGVNYIDDSAQFGEGADFRIIDPYINVVYTAPYGVNLSLGGRLNNHSEYGSHFVYNVNPSYHFDLKGGSMKVLASYATSYITPSLTQLFGPFGANPELEPEENRTIEGGVEFANGNKVRASAVYFNRKEENYITFGPNFTNINAENTIDAQGMELELDWRPLEKLRLSTNYTFTERKGDLAIRLPKHALNAHLDYSLSQRTQILFDYEYTGDRVDQDFNQMNYPVVDLEPFSLFDIRVNHQIIQNKLTGYVLVANIFNEDYTEVIGFSTRGRNVLVGLRLQL